MGRGECITCWLAALKEVIIKPVKQIQGGTCFLIPRDICVVVGGTDGVTWHTTFIVGFCFSYFLVNWIMISLINVSLHNMLSGASFNGFSGISISL